MRLKFVLVRTSEYKIQNVGSAPIQARFAASVPAEPSNRASWIKRTVTGESVRQTYCSMVCECACRLIRISVLPELAQRSSQMSIRGLPRIGTRHLGTESVIGRKRVPCPPASKKAFNVRSPDLKYS